MAALSYAVDGYIATITIQHPPANALSTQVLEDLSACLDELSERQDVRSIVIHGEGRFFSAGADIKEFTSLMDGSDYANLADKGQQIFEKVESFPKPVIAANSRSRSWRRSGACDGMPHPDCRGER